MATDYLKSLPFFGSGIPGEDKSPLGGLFYDSTADDEAAQAGIDKGTAAYDKLTPTVYKPVDYTGPQEAADINAAPIGVDRVGDTAMNGITLDPQYKAAQIAQLSALQELRDNGGYNLTDKANLRYIGDEEAAKEQSQRAAIMQNAQMRGMGGSNMNIMAQLNASQQAANR